MDMEIKMKKIDADAVKNFAKSAWDAGVETAVRVKDSEAVQCLAQKTTGYIREMEIRDLALVKTAALAAGFLAGLFAPEKWKKPLMVLAGIVFVMAYVPAMVKFVKKLLEK